MNPRVISILLFITAAALMVYTSFPAEPFPRLFKVGHFLLFCLFAFAVYHLLNGVVHAGGLLLGLSISSIRALRLKRVDT